MSPMQRILAFGSAALVAAIAAVIPFFRDGAIAPGPSEGASSSSVAVSSAPASPGSNTTGLPLVLPAGYSIETLAEVPGARVIAKDGFGNYWVSQPSKGTVSPVSFRLLVMRAPVPLPSAHTITR